MWRFRPLVIQRGQQLRASDPHQVMEVSATTRIMAGVAGLFFEPPHGFDIAFEILDGVGVVVDVAVLQESVALEAGHAEQAGGLAMGELFGA